jgi:hypothetical protein
MGKSVRGECIRHFRDDWHFLAVEDGEATAIAMNNGVVSEDHVKYTIVNCGHDGVPNVHRVGCLWSHCP